MDLSEKGAVFMRLHEGYVGKWYLDPVGIPTIGIGFTWRSTAFRKWWQRNKPNQPFARGAYMTRAEAEGALRYLCKEEYGKAVNKFLGKKVPQHVFDGTVSPVYNLGPGSLEWRWAKAVKAGDYSDAAAKLRVTGTTAQGRKLAGLVRRRKEEALLIERGIYTGVDTAHSPSPDAMADGVLTRGERGKDVGQLIRDLDALGYYEGAMDDVFGYGTEAAVMAFQEAESLTRDGVAGPQTLAAIKAAMQGVADIPHDTAAQPNLTIPEIAQEAADDPRVSIWAALLGILTGRHK